MFKKIAILLFISLSLQGFAQEVSVEKSIFDVQLGLVGLWANHELKLTKQLALRSEIGLELGFAEQTSNGVKSTYSVLAPNITLEPKWYYNLEKRFAKGKNIKRNSGNFIAIKAHYLPDLFLITGNKNLNIVNQLAIIPQWGIRRVSGKHISFETGFGLGPQLYFGKGSKNVTNRDDVYVDLNLRVGYSF